MRIRPRSSFRALLSLLLLLLLLACHGEAPSDWVRFLTQAEVQLNKTPEFHRNHFYTPYSSEFSLKDVIAE